MYIRINVTHCTETIHLKASALHHEEIHLLITVTTKQPLVLRKQNPIISWNKEIIRWLKLCQKKCLQTPCVSLTSMSIESPDTTTQVNTPEQYFEFTEVFNKTRAEWLPPHHPHDCSIDLLSDLSLPEQQVMEECIEEALQQGYIRPGLHSTSPALAGFFFVEKGGGGGSNPVSIF